MTNELKIDCKTLDDHEIGRRANYHDGITHPTGPQICLKCGKSLREIVEEREKELVGEIELWFLRLHNEPKKWTVAQALKKVLSPIQKYK